METATAEAGRRSPVRLVLLLLALAGLLAAFLALGTWQVHRRAWKLDLIARVEQRLRSPPVAAPGRDAWPGIGIADEYLKVRVDGRFVDEGQVFVQALTARGPGFWVLTPLKTGDGTIVLVNRGFVEAKASSSALPEGLVTVTGLLRVSEPHGGFLRRNDPATQRWFSRDVAAIAAAHNLPAQLVAPYFIDADATAAGQGGPVGGMTVVQFHNSHLVYAITWYTLALMVAGAAVIVLRRERWSSL